MTTIRDSDKLFIHVPKAAGTAFVKAYCHGRNVHHKRAINLTPEEFARTVCIVRNPYERLWSAYNYIRQEKNMYHDNSNGSTTKHTLHDKLINLTFTEFVTALYNKEISRQSVHLKTQAWFIVNSTGRPCPIMLRYEHLAYDLRRMLNLDASRMPVLNKSTESNSWSKQYTANTMRMVYEIYKVDFDLCGYTRGGKCRPKPQLKMRM